MPEATLLLHVKLSFVIEFIIEGGDRLNEARTKSRVAGLLTDRIEQNDGKIYIDDIDSVELIDASFE